MALEIIREMNINITPNMSKQSISFTLSDDLNFYEEEKVYLNYSSSAMKTKLNSLNGSSEIGLKRSSVLVSGKNKILTNDYTTPFLKKRISSFGNTVDSNKSTVMNTQTQEKFLHEKSFKPGDLRKILCTENSESLENEKFVVNHKLVERNLREIIFSSKASSSLNKKIPAHKTSNITVSDFVTLKTSNINNRTENLTKINELCKENSFFSYTNHLQEDPLKINYHGLLVIAKQILEALALLEEKKSFHGNISPENILINPNLSIKLSDCEINKGIFPVIFESCNDAIDDDDSLFEQEIFHWYRSPEIILEQNSESIKSDIWALGCCLLELILGDNPFKVENAKLSLFKVYQVLGILSKEENPVLENMLSNLFSFIEGKKVNSRQAIEEIILERGVFIDSSFTELLCCMLEINKEIRISPTEALNSDLFKNVPLRLNK